MDFIISGASSTIAIEVKVGSEIAKSDIKGLLAFAEEHPKTKNIVVCSVPKARIKTYGDIEVLVLPVASFLKQLWDMELVG